MSNFSLLHSNLELLPTLYLSLLLNSHLNNELLQRAKVELIDRLMESQYFLSQLVDPTDKEFSFKMYENEQFKQYIAKSDNKNFMCKNVTDKMAEERLEMNLNMVKMKIYQTVKPRKQEKNDKYASAKSNRTKR